MRRLLAILLASIFAFSAQAQSLSVSPNGQPPGGASLTVQYNNAGVFAGMAGTSWDNTNRSLTITGATVTGASAPILNLTQTWNNAATTFEAVKINVTQTAAAAASALLDLQVGGVSKFNVRQNGVLTLASNLSLTGTGSVIVQNNTGLLYFGAALDVIVGRNAAASLRLGNPDAAAPVAQTLGVQSVVAGTSNTAGVNWTIKGSTSTGSGVAGDIILQTGGTGAGATAQNAFVTALTIKGATQDVVFGKSATFAEMTAPSAPAANGATLYCDDNGAGKTRCSILFATGAAQQFAIEP